MKLEPRISKAEVEARFDVRGEKLRLSVSSLVFLSRHIHITVKEDLAYFLPTGYSEVQAADITYTTSIRITGSESREMIINNIIDQIRKARRELWGKVNGHLPIDLE